MSEQLQKAIADVLVVVKDGATFAAAAAKQELPLLVQEYLRWGMAEAVIWMVLGLMVLITYGVTAPRVYRWAESTRNYDAGFAYLLLGGVLTLIGLIEFVLNSFVVVQIYVAPRVYLLEKLTELVK